MGTTATILPLWVAFAASHMGLSSHRLRPRLVARLGERGFTALYSLLAFASFVSLVGVYLPTGTPGRCSGASARFRA